MIWIIAAATLLLILARPGRVSEGVWACSGAFLLLVLRVLSPADALAAVGRGTDVYLFLTGMMVLAELGRREGFFKLSARVIPLRVKGKKGIENRHVLGRVSARGNIHNDEPIHAGRLRKRKLHGHLAAEGMTEDVHAVELARVEKFREITGHDVQSHVIAVRGKAMVAQIHKKHMELLREFGSDPEPVIGRAEKAVEHDQWRTLAEFFEIKLH